MVDGEHAGGAREGREGAHLSDESVGKDAIAYLYEGGAEKPSMAEQERCRRIVKNQCKKCEVKTQGKSCRSRSLYRTRKVIKHSRAKRMLESGAVKIVNSTAMNKDPQRCVTVSAVGGEIHFGNKNN